MQYLSFLFASVVRARPGQHAMPMTCGFFRSKHPLLCSQMGWIERRRTWTGCKPRKKTTLFLHKTKIIQNTSFLLRCDFFCGDFGWQIQKHKKTYVHLQPNSSEQRPDGCWDVWAWDSLGQTDRPVGDEPVQHQIGQKFDEFKEEVQGKYIPSFFFRTLISGFLSSFWAIPSPNDWGFYLAQPPRWLVTSLDPTNSIIRKTRLETGDMALCKASRCTEGGQTCWEG